MVPGLKRIRIIHRLRTAVALLGFLAIVAAIGGLLWANHTGLPESWRTKIEQELSNRGLHAEIESLRIRPLQGIEARGVLVFADEARSRTLARLQSLQLDIDRTKLSRGEVKIDRIDLSGARISIAADPKDPTSKVLDIEEAEGRLILHEGRRFEIQGASGMIGGIRVELDCDLLNYRPNPDPTPEEIEQGRLQRIATINGINETLEQWGPESPTPPLVRIRSTGDLDESETVRTHIELAGTKLRSRSLEIPNIVARAELRGPALVVHHLEVRTEDGGLIGNMEFDLWKHEGRFELRSSLDPATILTDLELPLPERMAGFGKPPVIEARGTVSKEDENWKPQVIGRVEMVQPSFAHLTVDQFNTSFSWDGNQLFLEDAFLKDGGHQLTGRAFITSEEVRYQARTDLPVEFWQNTIRLKKLGKVLADFGGGTDSTVSGDFNGVANLVDRTKWTFNGEVTATDISFRGVPVKRARATLDLSHPSLDFTNGEVTFDYRDYAMRKKYGGPMAGQIEVDRVRFDREPSTVTITKLRGDAWVPPIVRTFAPSMADNLEDYGFHSTPSISADGVVGFRHGASKQDLAVRFSSDRPLDHKFVGKTLTLTKPRGTVRVRPSEVQVSNLSFGVFDGVVRGNFRNTTDGSKKISGEIDWTSLSLPRLSKTYDLKGDLKGRITGRLDFRLGGNSVGDLSGNGHVALDGGELFEVPIFGPLSPVISTVVGERKAGFQEASEAFFTFDLNQGVLTTLDFHTSTDSIVITGDAKVDLTKKTMQMTLRVNARGLLGVITIPLRPFYGMFQFRGTGPIDNPEWENVMFTKPPKQQKENLLEPPKARRIGPPGTR